MTIRDSRTVSFQLAARDANPLDETHVATFQLVLERVLDGYIGPFEFGEVTVESPPESGSEHFCVWTGCLLEILPSEPWFAVDVPELFVRGRMHRECLRAFNEARGLRGRE